MNTTGTASMPLAQASHQHFFLDQHRSAGLGRLIRSSLEYVAQVYRSTDVRNIRYDDSFGIGLPGLDGRRQTIVGVYNAFNNDLRQFAGMRGHASRLTETAALLVRLVSEHFSFEETLMNESGYPTAAAHTAGHVRFLENLHGELERIQGGSADMYDLSYLIGSWLRDHMRGADKAFGEYLLRAAGDRSQPVTLATAA